MTSPSMLAEHPSVANPIDSLSREFLEIPGFVGQVMRYCLDTAPYPNAVLAFSGAIALQSFLAGRQVRDAADNRPNLYIIALAMSGAGKDWPRKLNTAILDDIGLLDCLGDKLASGEGLQDALKAHPSLLFQTDEFDTLLQAMAKARDHRYESIMAMLLTLYTASNSVMPLRRLSGDSSPGVIQQPHLVVLGTAIPKHYYASLSERMLTNGLAARLMIFDAGRRGPGQRPTPIDPPKEILDVARWWAKENAHRRTGSEAPKPRTVPESPEATELKERVRAETEREYAAAEACTNECAMTVWARVYEHACKLSLLYAVSENAEDPVISADAVQWATDLVFYLARRSLADIEAHASESRFDASLRKCLRIIGGMPQQSIERSDLLKRMSIKAGELNEIVDTLMQREEICEDRRMTTGRTATIYRRISKEGE